MAPAELEAVLLSTPTCSAPPSSPWQPHRRRCPEDLRRDPQQVSADELMAYVAERVAPCKKVRAVEFIEQIPKSPAGKILRHVP